MVCPLMNTNLLLGLVRFLEEEMCWVEGAELVAAIGDTVLVTVSGRRSAEARTQDPEGWRT